MNGYVKEMRALVGHRPLYLPGAAVFVFNREGQILLQRRSDDGKWGIPGGVMEPGDTYEETAVREVWEETGLRVKSLRLYHVFSGKAYLNQYPNGDQALNALAAFLCTEYEGELQIRDEESVELGFFELQQLPELSKISDRVVRHYIEHHGNGPIVYRVDGEEIWRGNQGRR